MPLVLHFAEPWLSEQDIRAGERWIVELRKELQDAQFGIIVLTPESLQSAWLIFEAGALSNAFQEARVCPYLVGLELKELSGPLSQFQAKKADRQSTLELMQGINAVATQQVEKIRLVDLFDVLWPRLEKTLLDLPSAAGSSLPPRSNDDVLEELVKSVRRMDARLDQAFRERPSEPQPATVVVRGVFPGLAEGVEDFKFVPERDLVEEVGAIAKVNIEDYGTTWYLIEPGIKRTLVRADGPQYVRRSRSLPLNLLLMRQEDV